MRLITKKRVYLKINVHQYNPLQNTPLRHLHTEFRVFFPRFRSSSGTLRLKAPEVSQKVTDSRCVPFTTCSTQVNRKKSHGNRLGLMALSPKYFIKRFIRKFAEFHTKFDGVPLHDIMSLHFRNTHHILVENVINFSLLRFSFYNIIGFFRYNVT